MTDRHTGAPTDDSGARQEAPDLFESQAELDEFLAEIRAAKQHPILTALKPLAAQFAHINLLNDQGLFRGSFHVPADRAELVGQPQAEMTTLVLSVEDAVRLARAWRESQ